jgi:SAM-dependent methyltransferase
MPLTSLRVRDRRPEVMDDPSLPAADHRRALAGLARINRWTGAAKLLWRPLRALAARRPAPLRVLDVATGSGDIPLALARLARRAGVPMSLAGCDLSPTAVAEANQQSAAALPTDSPHFFTHDALRDPLPAGYDAVVCSLFLHHLDEPDAVQLLSQMKAAAGKLVLVNDLARGRFNYCAVWLAARVLSRSPVVHVDGPLSVRAAFTVAEMRRLAEQAGLTGAVVSSKFPCRQLLTWENA